MEPLGAWRLGLTPFIPFRLHDLKTLLGSVKFRGGPGLPGSKPVPFLGLCSGVWWRPGGSAAGGKAGLQDEGQPLGVG